MNNNFYKYIVFILIINISIIKKGKSEENNKNFIIIPFKSYFPKIDYSPNYNKALINSWIRKKIYFELENSSGQNLQIILNSKDSKIHTREVVAVLRTEDKYLEYYNTNDSDICTFNYKNSNSYELTTDFNYIFYSISNVCYAKEKIYLYTDSNLKQKKLYDIEFIHSSNETHICFFAGLQITESIADEKIILLHQLKKLINSNSYTWTLKFTSPDEGHFIFGDIINNNKLNFYNDNIEDNYISLSVPTYSLDTINWKLFFEKVIIGDYIIKPDSQLYFFMNFERRYITVPKEYFYDIQKQYLLVDNYDENGNIKFICFVEETEFFYNSIYCKKKEYLEMTDNYKKLPTLNLFGYRLGVNITFTPQDLFIEKGDNIYFYIAYDSKNEEDWYIGTIFLEKYITVFDNYEKKLSILKKNNKEDNKNTNNKSFTNRVVLIIILVIIFSSFIFGLIGLIFGKKIYQKRKKKANELNDDEYDYSPQENKIEENKDNNLLIN